MDTAKPKHPTSTNAAASLPSSGRRSLSRLWTRSSSRYPESNATWQPYARTHRDAWTLGELIAKVLGFEPDKTDGTGLSQSDARDILARYGIRTGPGTGKKDERIGGGTQIWIANRNDALSRAIAKHPWGSNGWHQYLARLPGATKSGAEVKKFAGSTSCWVSLPRGLIDRED